MASEPLTQLDETDHPSSVLFRRLWDDYIYRFWPLLLLSIVLMTVEGTAIGAFAWLVGPLFDELFAAESFDGAAWVAFAIGALFVVRATSGFFQRVLVVSIGLRIITSLQMNLVEHLLKLDLPVFRDNSPGSLIERVRGDATALQSVSSTVLMTLGRDSITLISLLAVMLYSDWQWTILALVGVPLLVLPLIALQRFIRKTVLESRVAAAALTMRLDEIFHGIQTIKLNRLERSETDRYRKATQDFLAPSVRAQIGTAANPALIDVLAAIGFVAVLYVGGQQIIAGQKTVGEFMSFFTALGLLFEPLRRLSGVAAGVAAASASLQRIYAVFEAQPSIVSPPTPQPLQTGDIVFEDVRLAFGEAQVLRGLSFTARAGETTALVGASGAGKTTVFAVLTRLIDPQAGAVSLGGVPVNQFALDRLRDTVAVVGQETALFDETIRTNIAMGNLEATEAQVHDAARDAAVLEFTDKMPEGLETKVGPRGSGLSGGQRQRVAIARAMLKPSPILLLDEPTSALDAQSERLVSTALDRLAEGRTTLVIAHRLSTVRDAHKIVVLEAGRVVEEGTHTELLAKGGAYKRLHHLQMEGETL